MEQAFEVPEVSDIEIAMYFLRLMDEDGFYHTDDGTSHKSLGHLRMAEEAVKKMRNPFAISLLKEKIASHREFSA